MSGLHTTRNYYQVEKEAIGFIRFIFEGYDGIAVVTTESVSTSVIIITIAPGCESEVVAVIESLKPEITITPLDRVVSDDEIIY